ncbi:AAA family ATPase [Candidatus Dojkabacteria bacterium]|uniref:AAA family ATPase n=1 Tax=Candidatus Dojkabacteria bacterium TaxID=2099670 RepID=A0A955RKT4_9BACT|nr:AAA family ATPase [Candidatus Dojkabacteria bacterium]
MNLTKVKLIGFRNFKNTTINLNEKSLLFGANDVGKTNLIYALRLLLDKSISEADFEPLGSDFYSHEDCNEYSITIFFENVDHDAVRSQLGHYIGDDDKFCIKYIVSRQDSEALSFESNL